MEPENRYSSKELLTHLLDNIDDNIYFKDRESRFILINAAFARRLRVRPQDVIGKTDFDIFTEEHARPAFEAEQRIIQTGEPLLGLEEKETWVNGHTTWVSTSKMPLRNAQDEIIGTFGMSRDITEHKLTEIKLRKFARRLTAVHNQMQEELQMAANLQLAFTPQFYPEFPADPSTGKCADFAHSYLANTQISGDLCSVVKLSETEAGLLIFDVMGHGVRAALITAILYTMINDLSRKGLSPGGFLSEMNRQLRPMLKRQDSFIFVTAACLFLNVKTGNLRGASAGHTTPLLIQPKNGGLDILPLNAALLVNGPAIGIAENVEYKTFTQQLHPDDSLLLYTDGLVEETNSDEEEFGMARAEDIIRRQESNDPKEICRALIDAVKTFNGGDQLSDDVCLLACRWNGRSG
jgi:sigma-B regulation protein RsbU (phosphoserine phosphatase)